MGVNLQELEESNSILINHTTFSRRIPVFLSFSWSAPSHPKER